MACFHPLTAYRSFDGQIRFDEKRNGEPLELPCGQCIGCRLERSREWAIRMVHEASMHEDNCFITLTYAPEYLPPDGSLVKSDFQKFMKRLRKQVKKKFVSITVENMAMKIKDPTITQFYSATTSMIGSIYSTLLAVRLFTQAQLSKRYGKKDS